MTRCVGAFRRECPNLTERILCAACYALVDKVMDDLVPSSRPKRQVYRRHNAKATG